MKFGIVMFPTDYAIDPVTLGRAVEERGFDSLFFPEHTHIPASRRTPWPGGARSPAEYSHTYDLFVALTAVAAIDREAPARHRHLPRRGARPDHARQGSRQPRPPFERPLLFGVGGGWNREEMENHGTDPRTRLPLMRERILAMKEIWTKDDAEYHGKYVNFDPIWSWPKPVQKPHPPILVGGDGPHALQRVIEYGDGWMPIPMPAAKRRSRRPSASSSTTWPKRPAAAASRHRLRHARAGGGIAHYADIGIERCIFWLPPVPEAEAIPPRPLRRTDRKSGARWGVGQL